MGDIKAKIKKAINESDSRWKATKVYTPKIETDLSGTVMWIEVNVKKR